MPTTVKVDRKWPAEPAGLTVYKPFRVENRAMLQLARDVSPFARAAAVTDSGDYGVWTGYQIPDDRADWHPLVRCFYDYWASVSPRGRLPGRQDIAPEEVPALWSRMWMLDVYRDPLRFRYRLCGTEMVRSLGREVTGAWLDVAHPQLVENPQSNQRFRFIAETGRATWRRGSPLWTRDPEHRTIETCIAPLAADGFKVDKILGISVMFDSQGKPI